MLTSISSRKERQDLPVSLRRTLTPWVALEKQARSVDSLSLKTLFARDPLRFERFHARMDGLLLDYSKQHITADILTQLLALAKACDLDGWRTRMFAGDKINSSEDRPVLHTALRSPSSNPLPVDGQDVMPLIHGSLKRMKDFTDLVRNHKRFTYVVNIGIGGSDLGPHMAYEALKAFSDGAIKLHFVSDMDAAHLIETLKLCDPAKTLFIVTSKSFTTVETLMNARSAQDWLKRSLGKEDVSEHFVAVTQNIPKAVELGVTEDRVFPIWDWVGGRYSLWSAVGLPLSLALGFEHFMSLLAGAYAMDRHFLTAPAEKNLPVLLALIGVWNHTFLRRPALALLPYSRLLQRFPAYVQQLDMESNGKTVDRDGSAVDYLTGPIIFGDSGTNGQHAFYQLLHQGTTVVPCEFIAVSQPVYDAPTHHIQLHCNVIGQSKALMDGKPDTSPHKIFEGNRPSTTLVMEKLDPYHVGMLTALYEHKVFTQGIIWNLNSFDQWGVELGKTIAAQVMPALSAESTRAADFHALDSSTRALIDLLRDSS